MKEAAVRRPSDSSNILLPCMAPSSTLTNTMTDYMNAKCVVQSFLFFDTQKWSVKISTPRIWITKLLIQYTAYSLCWVTLYIWNTMLSRTAKANSGVATVDSSSTFLQIESSKTRSRRLSMNICERPSYLYDLVRWDSNLSRDTLLFLLFSLEYMPSFPSASLGSFSYPMSIDPDTDFISGFLFPRFSFLGSNSS